MRKPKPNPRIFLDPEHASIEEYVQRMESRYWRQIVLAYEDWAIFNGVVRDLVAVNVGNRVVEVSKGPDASNFCRLRGLDRPVPPQSNALPSPSPECTSPLVET